MNTNIGEMPSFPYYLLKLLHLKCIQLLYLQTKLIRIIWQVIVLIFHKNE